MSLFVELYFTYIVFDNLSSEVFGIKQARKQTPFLVLSKIFRSKVGEQPRIIVYYMWWLILIVNLTDLES